MARGYNPKVISQGAGPGVLGPYKANPRWFAYNGDTPVFIKSYYNKAGGFTRQDPHWAAEHFYSKIFVERGYNHHMSSGFMPVLPLLRHRLRLLLDALFHRGKRGSAPHGRATLSDQ